MKRNYILGCLLGVMAGLTFSAIAQERANSTGLPSTVGSASARGNADSQRATHTTTAAKTTPETAEERAQRLEGEKRFRTNCGRCHQAPHKFPPRVMAAALRHMRVRAMITDEDMRLILRYMTQ